MVHIEVSNQTAESLRAIQLVMERDYQERMGISQSYTYDEVMSRALIVYSSFLETT